MRDDLPSSRSGSVATMVRTLAHALRHPLYSLGLKQHRRFPAVDVAYVRYLATVEGDHCAQCPHGVSMLLCAAHPPGSGRPYDCPLGEDGARYVRRPLPVATVTPIARRPERATPLRLVRSAPPPVARDQGTQLGP